jgi:hypothetical protein
MHNLLHTSSELSQVPLHSSAGRTFSPALRLSAAMVLVLVLVLVLAVVLPCRGTSAQEGFEGWHLEPGVGQAHLTITRLRSLLLRRGRISIPR